MLEEILAHLDEIVADYEADGVKVYYNSKECYCIKVIKKNRVIKKFLKGSKAWDLKKGKQC